MTRTHRRRHVLIWLVLGPLIFLGIVMGISARPRLPVESDLGAGVMPAEDIGASKGAP